MKMVFTLTTMIFSLVSFSQHSSNKSETNEKVNSLGISLSVPLNKFSSTHTIGAVVEYKRNFKSSKRDTNRIDRSIVISVTGGASYYLGKTVTTAGYEFNYSNYLLAYILAGLDFKPIAKTIINLSAGPVMGIYKRNTDFGVGTNLSVYYYLSDKLAIGPGLFLRKFGKTDALWSGAIGASYAF